MNNIFIFKIGWVVAGLEMFVFIIQDVAEDVTTPLGALYALSVAFLGVIIVLIKMNRSQHKEMVAAEQKHSAELKDVSEKHNTKLIELNKERLQESRENFQQLISVTSGVQNSMKELSDNTKDNTDVLRAVERNLIILTTENK